MNAQQQWNYASNGKNMFFLVFARNTVVLQIYWDILKRFQAATACSKVENPWRRNIIFYSSEHLFNYKWMSEDKASNVCWKLLCEREALNITFHVLRCVLIKTSQLILRKASL